ncbi:MAG: hypothetical protein QXU93_11655 [Thermoproteus sp.]
MMVVYCAYCGYRLHADGIVNIREIIGKIDRCPNCGTRFVGNYEIHIQFNLSGQRRERHVLH